MILSAVLVSPVGKLGIETKNQSLVAIHFLSREAKTVEPSSDLATEVVRQLKAYFARKLTTFTLPMYLAVTTFERTVLNSLCSISFGQTVTYGDLAKSLETGPRAIGNACRKNPLPIIIPCHRVVARNHLGGYSGALSGENLLNKRWLLEHESKM